MSETWVRVSPYTAIPSYVTAVQNERQPRNTAQIRHDQLDPCLDGTTLGPAHATVSATHPAFSPAAVGNHRFLTNIVSTETGTKSENDSDGRDPVSLLNPFSPETFLLACF